MKRFSRSISLFVLVAMTVLCLVGCATSKPQAQVETVTEVQTTEQPAVAVEEAPKQEEKPEAVSSATVTETPASTETSVGQQALEYSFDVYGYAVSVEAYDGYAYVTYPEFVTDAELAAAAKAALAAYPKYLSSVTYQITAPGKVTVNFMKGLTKSDADYAIDLLKSNLTWYVGQLFAATGTEAPKAEGIATATISIQTGSGETASSEEVYPYGVTPIVKDASGATEFSLYIVHTNDVHARVTEGQDGSMGYAKLATLLKWGRSLTDDILLLDAGDVTHGTNFANLFKGQTVLNLLDMLGYDAVAPGNHDFNYGFDVLLQDAKTAEKYSNTRVLCANILDEDGYLMFQPYQIYDFNGFKVAVIGLSTPDTKTKAHPKYTEGLTFMSDLVVNNAQYALDLAHQYADYVVVLGHIGEDADGSSGITSDWICENLNGIDLFVDGHSHTDEPGKVVNGALIVQAGQYLKEVGVV
ncbi:MAG: metallophosphoesterase, partial [Sphaerochaetaceae bacterium]|nr:metallophosphoesterase [Sphaerochaetaceae bacterium]